MSNGDDPHQRKAHVKRIYQMDPISQEIDKGTWIDVLRIDSTFFDYRTLPDGMTRTGDIFKFRWNDDPFNRDPAVDDPQQENANAKRKTHRIILKNPDDPGTTSEDPEGPSSAGQTFDGLWIVDKATINMRQGLQPGDFSGATSQDVVFVFNNRPDTVEPTKRKVTAVIVTNNDLGAGGDDTSVGGDAINMDDLKIVDWDTYKKALQSGKKNESQKIYMEVVDKVPIRFGASAPLGLQNQIINYVFTRNEDIENLTDPDGNNIFEKAPEDANTVRADPLQLVVNVQWGTNLLGFHQISPDEFNILMVGSKDGTDWEIAPNESGKKIWCAAYGDGVWLGVDPEGNVYKSTDLAKTWTVINSFGFGKHSVGGQCIGYKIITNNLGGDPEKVWVAASDNTRISRSTDTGKSWATTLDVTGELDQLFRGFDFMALAGDYFIVGGHTGGVTDDQGNTTTHPNGIVWTSKDGISWARNDFRNSDWSSVNPDDFANEHFVMIGATYDDKTKLYAVFGQAEAVISSLLVGIGSTPNVGGGTTIAIGTYGSGPPPGPPKFPITSWNSGFPSGGNGYFVFPAVERGFPEANIPNTAQACVFVSQGGSGWRRVDLLQRGDFRGPNAPASIYYKSGKAFIATITPGPNAGSIMMSDDKAANWEVVDSDFDPQFYVTGPVGSWANPPQQP